ncbi:hypothetical protein [uncultured Chryseobacterium sp.]|uniref:hypothetical protein n=1 Tax=uncultured Chryseobacterium sp. TaxID=259322 RepID=UPI0025DF4F45|nr:hypothetical protein [uncultured Chryseobacterium sp.]
MKGAEILNKEQKEKVKINLLSKLDEINKELDNIRNCSALTEGFGTMRLAKKQRKAEELSKQKFAIIQILFDDFGIEII